MSHECETRARVSRLIPASRNRIGAVLKAFAAVFTWRNQAVDECLIVAVDLNVQEADIVVEVIHRSWADDDRRQGRVGETPRQGEL